MLWKKYYRAVVQVEGVLDVVARFGSTQLRNEGTKIMRDLKNELMHLSSPLLIKII